MSDRNRFPTTGRDQLHGPGHDGYVKPLHGQDFEQYVSAFDQQVQRTRPADAPDLRSAARRDVDELHKLIAERTIKKFGRSPSMDSSRQVSDRVAFLLRQAQAAESVYINASERAGTPPAHVEELRQACADAYESWLNAATAGWPSAQAARRRQDDDLRTGIGSRAGFLTGSRR